VKRIGADKEQALDPSECRLQGFGPIEIGLPLFHTQSRKFVEFPRCTRGGDHFFCSEPPKFRHGSLSEVSIGARHKKLLVCKTHSSSKAGYRSG
jgi:hypothetical protein